MAIKIYRPTTPGQRGMTSQDFSSLTVKKPLKSLTSVNKKHSGRNARGVITTRHQGGGTRRFYRHVNFGQNSFESAVVEAIEYDPNRSARIARVKDSAGHYHYVLAPHSLKVGQTLTNGPESPIETGNRLELKNIPVGSTVHAIELIPGKGAQLVRSAGTGAQLMAKENGMAQIKLPSGEVRLIREECTASIGNIGNDQHQNIKYGKAGRRRKMGIRPTVRGVVQNAVDHPHGGGDGGKHGVGGSKDHGTSPRTPWGQKTLGYKTRRRKISNKFIVRSRHASKRG